MTAPAQESTTIYYLSPPKRSPMIYDPKAREKLMAIKPKALFASTLTTGAAAPVSSAKVVGGVGKPTWEKTTPVELDRLSRLFK